MSDIDFPALLHLLDLAVFERQDDDAYVARSPLPAWAIDALAVDGSTGPIALRTRLPFLDHFLADADAFWWGRKDGAVASSPFAVHAAAGEHDYLLRAWAVRQGSLQLIVVLNLSGEADLRPILQTAREQQLAHDALVRQLAIVPGAVDAIARAARQLDDASTADAGRQAAVASIARAADALQAAAASFPTPPPGPRGHQP